MSNRHSAAFYYGFRGILGYTVLLPLSPQKESRKCSHNSNLRLFLYLEKCTKNAPSFSPALQKSPFEGVWMGFSTIFTGVKWVCFHRFSPQFSPQFIRADVSHFSASVHFADRELHRFMFWQQSWDFILTKASQGRLYMLVYFWCIYLNTKKSLKVWHLAT